MQRLSVSEFIFMTIRACWPASCAATVRSISRGIPARGRTGETSALRKSCGRAWPVSELNMSVTSAARPGAAGKRPESPASRVGFFDRLAHEPVDARAERVGGMVDEEVALAHGCEDVGAPALGHLERGLADRRPRRVAQLHEAVQVVQLPQVRHVEQALDVVDL